jgi:hypothetical protein
LRTPHGIAANIQKLVDASNQRNIIRAIIAAITRALKRAQLRKARFPIAQYVLRQGQLPSQLTYGQKCPGFFAHAPSCTGRGEKVNHLFGVYTK